MKGGLFLSEYSTVPVKVSYNNGDYFETYFYLNAILLDKIEVVKEPKKTSYKSGEKISYKGIDVIVTYQDMSFIVLSNFSCTFDPPEGTEFPELEDITTYSEENEPCLNVSIKYAEGKDEKECTLTLYAITFVLEIETQPTKIKYHEGENISYSGLVVNAVYSDESVEDVTSQCSFSVEEGKAFDPLTDTDVEISYKGQTCNLTLKEASGGGSGDCTLTITTQPTITGYHEGEEISYEGMVAKIVANDGSNSEFDVTAYCDVSPAEGTSINTDTKAEVKAAPPLTPYIYDYNCGYIANGVWIYENPTNTFIDIYQVKAGHQYYLTLGASVGSRFRAMFTTTDITTITTNTRITGETVVNVNNPSTYANATYTPSTNGYICVAKDNVGVSNLYSYLFDRSATSQEKTKKANIDLRCLILDSISVTPPPYTTFRINEILDYTGCEVIAHYTNDFSQDVTANATFSPAAGSLMSRGLNRVNVSYTEAGITKTGSFNVEVALLTGLEIETPPTKVIYAQNETLDYTGIVVYAVFSDGGTSDVTEYVEYSIPAGTVLSNLGEQTITVSYRDSANDTASTELKIKVYEKIVKSLTITPPTKTSYRLGDNVDLTGCVVIANYSNDTTADVTNSCVFTPANNSQITNAIDSIAVSYTENEVTVTGTINVYIVTLDYLTLENNGKSSYAIGEALDYSGITATAHYSNGNSKDVTADTVFTPAAGSIITSSAIEITATYTEGTKSICVKLNTANIFVQLLHAFEYECEIFFDTYPVMVKNSDHIIIPIKDWRSYVGREKGSEAAIQYEDFEYDIDRTDYDGDYSVNGGYVYVVLRKDSSYSGNKIKAYKDLYRDIYSSNGMLFYDVYVNQVNGTIFTISNTNTIINTNFSLSYEYEKYCYDTEANKWTLTAQSIPKSFGLYNGLFGQKYTYYYFDEDFDQYTITKDKISDISLLTTWENLSSDTTSPKINVLKNQNTFPTLSFQERISKLDITFTIPEKHSNLINSYPTIDRVENFSNQTENDRFLNMVICKNSSTIDTNLYAFFVFNSIYQPILISIEE